MSELNNKIVNAAKWSAISELCAKLIAPITNMVLARVLTPEAFGVVATLTMLIVFAEIFTDAGFQQYIIQFNFKNDEDKYKTANVAFISNLVMSIIIWSLITIYRNELAILVGNPGLGYVISIACLSIPIAAFSSIQMALYKRNFDFKTLFYTRIASIIVPLAVTLPLALWLRNYWALVFGTIVLNVINALILNIKSKWKPSLYYSFEEVKKMFSFCSWTLLHKILIWATNYIDIFFIGYMLNEYYLGIYKTSITTVSHITSLITATIIPILMPSLSRLQNNIPEMRKTILNLQKYTSILLLPLGTGIFIFSDLITDIMLGSQWKEASSFISIWGLIEVITIIFSRFCSNVYPAIGKPQISVLAQVLHLVVLIPAVIIAVNYGFTTLYWTRSLVRLEGILIHFILIYFLIKLSPIKIISNVVPEFTACIIMGLLGYFLIEINNNNIMSFVYIIICIIVYFLILIIIPKERIYLLNFISKLKHKKRSL